MDDVQVRIANVFSIIAAKNPEQGLRIPKSEGVTRRDVSGAFAHAFEMIGGVSRFTLWADQNPSDFYKLYARMLPVAALAQPESEQVREIRRVLIDVSDVVENVEIIKHSDAESV